MAPVAVRTPAGAPPNVAVGLGRLGHAVELWTDIGRDAHGQLIAEHLQNAGVRLATASLGERRTSSALARLDKAGSASYEFEISWSLTPIRLQGAPLAIHTGSIAAVLEPGATSVRRLLREFATTSTITYDPNVRPALMGPPSTARTLIEDTVSMCDVVKVSDEDLAWLYGDTAGLALALSWVAGNPGLVIVTRGARGAVACTAAGVIESAADPVRVVDTVGAGDAFMSGLLDGLLAAGLLGAD